MEYGSSPVEDAQLHTLIGPLRDNCAVSCVRRKGEAMGLLPKKTGKVRRQRVGHLDERFAAVIGDDITAILVKRREPEPPQFLAEAGNDQALLPFFEVQTELVVGELANLRELRFFERGRR